MWNFSLYKAILLILPPVLRLTRIKAWVKVSASWLHMIFESLKVFRYFTRRDITMTPQVAWIERFLNTRYGRIDIFIGEGYGLGPWVWNKTPETGEFDFFMDEPDSFIFAGADASNVGFVVNIPSSLAQEVQHIAAIVQRYKLPGKTFIIQIFTSL